MLRPLNVAQRRYSRRTTTVHPSGRLRVMQMGRHSRPPGDRGRSAIVTSKRQERTGELVTTYPDDADGAVLADLAAQGVDLSQPLLIKFHIAVPDEASAKKVFGAMAEAGYDSEIIYDEGEPDYDPDVDDEEEFGPSWSVDANVRTVPAYTEIVRIQAELDELARPFRGNSDGWGVTLGGVADA